MAVTALLKLAGLSSEARYVDLAHEAVTRIQPMMARYPLGFGQWLQALAYTLSKPREIAIVGDPDSADTQALLSVVRDGYQPYEVVALGALHGQCPGWDDVQLAHLRQLPSNATDAVSSVAAVPLLRNRGLVDGQATAYVCRDFACQAPVKEPDKSQAQLAPRQSWLRSTERYAQYR